MSKELKTLKNIEIRRPKGIELAYLDDYKERLKREAIRHIKELEKPNSMDLKFAVIQGIRGFQKDFIEKEWDKGNQYVISWIKDFFNITLVCGMDVKVDKKLKNDEFELRRN